MLLNKLRAIAVVLACWGMLFPLPAQAQTPELKPSASPSTAKVKVTDVALSKDSTIVGQVTDEQSRPRAGVEVTVRQTKGVLATAVTDSQGRYAFRGLQQGVYCLSSDKSVVICRVWNEKAAPPVASPQLLLVDGDTIVRGQRPLGDFFTSDAFLLAMVVAAAIAIPVAISNSRNNTSPSGS